MSSIRDAMRTRKGRAVINGSFLGFCVLVTSLSVIALGVLLVSIVYQGWTYLDWGFLTDYPSRHPGDAGFKAALWGSVWICTICAVVAIPLGVGTAVYLEEFAPKNRFTAIVQTNIANLAAVPSIVYGLIGLTAFARMWNLFGNARDAVFEIGDPGSFFYFKVPFGYSALTGGLTLMLVILPVVIISSQESLRAVPKSLRQGSRALGATQWLTVSRIVLPSAVPGVITGSILAMSRAIGEAAPLLMAGAALFLMFTPLNVMDPYSAMPLQIFNWAGRPQAEFREVAATGIIVLLAVLLVFNGTATFIRARFEKSLS